MHFNLALGGKQASVELVSDPVEVAASNGKKVNWRFLVADMTDGFVLGRDIFANLGIYVGGVSTKGTIRDAYPFDVDDVVAAVPGEPLPDVATAELLEKSNKADENYYLYLAELSRRAPIMFKELLGSNEKLTGFCTHPAA